MEGIARIDLGESRSVRRILADSVRLYRGYPWLFLALAAVVTVPWELAAFAATGHDPLGRARLAFAGWLTLMLLRDTFVGPLIAALHVHALTIVGDGERPRFAPVGLRGLRVLPTVAATGAASTVAIFAGFLLLIVPGVALLLIFAVAPQAAALECNGWIGALRSSGRLTDGWWRHVFLLELSLGVLSWGLLSLVRALPLGGATSAASVAAGTAAETVVASFMALALALLYFDLRSRAAAQVAATEPPAVAGD